MPTEALVFSTCWTPTWSSLGAPTSARWWEARYNMEEGKDLANKETNLGPTKEVYRRFQGSE